MNEIRKVLQKISTRLRELAGDYQDDGSEQRELEAVAFEAESLLASLPADGGAWYPSSMDVSRRADAAYANHDNIIRAAIDEYCSRGGQVGGEVVRQFRKIGHLNWTPCDMSDGSWAILRGDPERYETRELIARQPGAQAAVTVPAEVMDAAHRLMAILPMGVLVETMRPVHAFIKSIQGAGHGQG